MLFRYLGWTGGLPLLLEFALCGAVILIAGTRLSKFGDAIAQRTGLTRMWVGAIMLAVATSLPELINALAATAVVKQPDLAFGNLFGADCLNMLTIAILDIIHGSGPLISTLSPRLILLASLGMLLVGLSVMGVLLGNITGAAGIAAVGGWVVSLAIIGAYVLSMRSVFLYEKREPEEAPAQARRSPAVRHCWLGFFISAAFIVGAGLWLVQVADQLAVQQFTIGGRTFSLERTFVGTLLLAIITTLPELVVSITALRLGSASMALGNLLGSNCFNMLIIPLVDFVHGGGVYQQVSLTHAVTGLLALFLTGVLIAGMMYRSKKSFWLLGWDTLVIILAFLAGMYVVFSISIQGG